MSINNKTMAINWYSQKYLIIHKKLRTIESYDDIMQRVHNSIR